MSTSATGICAAPSPSIRTRMVRFDTLTPEDLDGWQGLRATNPLLDSPYFHPRFAEAVHSAGCEVQVVVGRDDGGKLRFLLPCHHDGALIRPAGWPAADFQGPVVAPGDRLSPLTLLTAGVRRFEFDHLIDGSGEFDPWVESRHVSPFVDTVGGLPGYLGRTSRSGKDNMGQARRRAAKAVRVYGSVRFAADVVDPTALKRLVELKRGQYAAAGVPDYFVKPGRRELLNRLLYTRGSSFAGILSTLHVGPHLAAAHFGIRADHVLHWWFPVYDPAFSEFSPGWILLRELVAASPQLGITRIDLGRGDDEYKRRAKTGESVVCRGLVTTSATHRVMRRTHHALIDGAKSSSLAPALRRIKRAVLAHGSSPLRSRGR